MRPDYLDSGGYQPSTQSAAPDLSASAAEAANAAASGSQNSYEVIIENIDLNLYKEYAFVFSYILANDDPKDTTIVVGPPSPRFVVTQAQVAAAIPDYTEAPTNVVATSGVLSYQVTWDKPTWENYTDTIIWEGTSSSFNGSEPVVWTGTGTQANILASSTADRYIKILHRDKFFHSNTTSANKFVIKGPIKPVDPIVVDTTGPGNVGSVTAVGSLDLEGVIGFHGHATISWAPVTGGGIRGYRIRWREVATTPTAYSYVDSPGTGTTYHLQGLGVGLTYEFAVATYDEYNNTSTQYVAGNNITISGTPYIAGTVDVSGYFRAKANPTDADSTAFKFGYGIEPGRRGLLFNANNYWYIDSNQSASLKVGGATSNYLLWNGTKLTIDGDINAKGGNFSGNIFMSTSGASIYNGTIDAATGNLTGNGFALNSTGLKVANGSNSVTLDAASGTITANAGSIGSWSLGATQIFKNNVTLDSSGYIQLGNSDVGTIIRMTSAETASSDGNTYRMWIGSNDPTTAAFRVTSGGKLYATSAKLNNIDIGSAFADGVTLGDVKSQAAGALSSSGTFSGTLSGNVQVTGYGTIGTVAAQAAAAVSDGTVDSKISTAFGSASNYSSAAIIQKINQSLGIGESSTSKINGSVLISGTLGVDALVGTYIYGKEIYQGYEPTYAANFFGGGVHLKQDVFPEINGYQPGIEFYGTNHLRAGIIGSWSDNNMTYATSYLGNYIDLFPADNSLNIKNDDTSITSTGPMYLSAATLSINKITRGRPQQTWTADPGRNYTITHNQGLGATIIANAEHALNDLVCTVRDKTESTAVIAVYHRAGAAVSGVVYVNWIAFSTTN
jgi:hypothetical protein